MAVTYVVMPGDSAKKIAKRFDISVKQLLSWNQLGNEREILPGMILAVQQGVNLYQMVPPLDESWCPRLYEGTTGPAVEELQRRLSKRRFYTGPIDGSFGESTKASVKELQRANQLFDHGVMTPETWALLDVYCRGHEDDLPDLEYGEKGIEVTFLQSLLKYRGYFDGKLTGYFGDATREAVIRLQRDYGLTPTGELDNYFWYILAISYVPEEREWDDDDDDNGYPTGEGNLEGVHFNWQEIDDFRYLLITDQYRYREGQKIAITFKKRNLEDERVVLRYPLGQLFDFYISDEYGNEVWRWSKGKQFNGTMREMILAPGEAEETTVYWEQKNNDGYWVVPGKYTIWGTNIATGVSIPLWIEIK